MLATVGFKAGRDIPVGRHHKRPARRQAEPRVQHFQTGARIEQRDLMFCCNGIPVDELVNKNVQIRDGGTIPARPAFLKNRLNLDFLRVKLLADERNTFR